MFGKCNCKNKNMFYVCLYLAYIQQQLTHTDWVENQCKRIP